MRALEIRLNKRKLCIAGVGSDGVIAAIVSCVLRNGEDELILDTSGLVSTTEENLRWHHRKLKVGDTVQISIVEASNFDKPRTRTLLKGNRDKQARVEK